MKNKKIQSMGLRLAVLGIAPAIFTALLFGQAQDSNLVGTVTDATGAAVVGASVTATNKATNVKYTAAADNAGEYRFNNVPVGRYDVSATAKGFSTATVANLDLQLNHTASVNLTLQVGAVSQSIEVREAAATIDTSTSQLQTTFESRAAVDLPGAGFSKTVNGAGIWNLSLLGAGVASSGGVGQGTGPSISGQRPENNSFNIDGVLNDNHYVTGPQVYISNEAVAQLNVLQNQMSAEFGSASGGVFNAVVKTGTNEIHGSIYEYLQNRTLNAMDQEDARQGLKENPRFDNNRLGATIGGPILKNKLFYFGNFEYNPLGQSANPGYVVSAPTSEGIGLLNGMSNLSKTNFGVFEKYVPVAAQPNGDSVNVNNVSIPIGDLSFASPNYYNNYNVATAIDWNISDKDQLRGRYFYNSSKGLDFYATLPVFFTPYPNVNNSVSLSEFHNFSPTMENELRISYSRNNNNISAGDFKYPGLDVFPNIAIDDISMQIGPDPNTPQGSIENLAQLQENLTKTWGRHTLKLGYDVVDMILTGTFVQRARGDYDYVSLQEFLLDQQPTGGDLSGVDGERSVGAENGVPFGFVQHAAYFNDDWRIRPNLTLNLGLRYEYVTVPVGSRAQQYSAIADVPGVITFRSPKSSNNDWAPRIGFAYSPGKDGVWSIRGGISRSFDNTYINLNQNAAPPYYQTTVDVDADHPVPNFLANGGLQGVVTGANPTPEEARQGIASYTFDQTRPYALTGTIGVQRLLGKDYTVEVRYVYTKGVHLWNQVQINKLSRVSATNNIPTFMSMPSAAALASLRTSLGDLQATSNNSLAQYGFPNTITAYHPWGNSKYHGLQMQMNKRYSKNFSYIAAFTWSHAQDDSTATNFSTIMSPRRAQDFNNMRAEWSDSALDRRLRFTIAPNYDFKPFQNGNWLAKNIIGNWNITLGYTYQSPEYATVQSGVDSNLNGDSAPDRAIVNPGGGANTGSAVTAYNAAGVAVASDIPGGSLPSISRAPASTVAYVAANPNARYIEAGLGAYANGGRNTFALAPTNNVDFALMKKINFGEVKRFEIGAQFFNIFNHPQFTGGYISDVSPYQTYSIDRSVFEPFSSSFGHYDEFFPSNSRAIQIVARIVF